MLKRLSFTKKPAKTDSAMIALLDTLAPLIVPLALTGALSGFLAGLLGVGGGIVIVPILAYMLEITGLHLTTPMHVAVGTSLAVIVPTSVISARAHFALGNVDRGVAWQLGPFVFIGALGGAVLADMFDNAALRMIFGCLATGIGASFLVRVLVMRSGLPDLPGRSVIGTSIGAASALVGIGGGSLTVPTLVSCGWDMRKAVGTSALMGLIIAVPGMISFVVVGWGKASDLPFAFGYVWLPAMIVIVGAAYFTTPFGALYSSKIDQKQLRRIFGVFLMLVGGRLVYSGYLAL